MNVQEERLEERRAAIIAAAHELFVENGYDAVSLTAIVRKSGGSLATLYKLFGSKEGLLLAIVRDDPGRPVFHEDIRVLTQKGEDPAAILLEIGLQLTAHLSRPDFNALLRILIGQSLRDTDWARRLDALVGEPAEKSLSESFARWQEEGVVEPQHDPDELAATFLALLIYPYHTIAIRGRATTANRAAMERSIRRFIRGCFVLDKIPPQFWARRHD